MDKHLGPEIVIADDLSHGRLAGGHPATEQQDYGLAVRLGWRHAVIAVQLHEHLPQSQEPALA